jgi:hypothetical protein
MSTATIKQLLEVLLGWYMTCEIVLLMVSPMNYKFATFIFVKRSLSLLHIFASHTPSEIIPSGSMMKSFV